MLGEAVDTKGDYGFSPYEKKQALKWLTEVQSYDGIDVVQLKSIQTYMQCIEKGFKVPNPLRPYFEELLRDEIEKYIGWIHKGSDPVTAINAVDDAHFFKRLYTVYGY